MSKVEAAKISWQGDTPISTEHDDVYYSKDDGFEESKYVFIKQNQLPQRWTEGALNTTFVLTETGFGSGLNFLAVWNTWINTPSPKRPIHFVSIEKTPLTKSDLEQAHSAWPELQPLKAELTKQYPHLIEGQHLLTFENGDVKLSLIFGDITNDFDKYSFSSDCWLLDGFAPSKNPDMWNNALFHFMARRSNNNATFATFTAAGFVKRGLIEAGFEVTKAPGFGRKREMLRGSYSADKADSTQENSNTEDEHYFSQHIPKWAIEDTSTTRRFRSDQEFDTIIIGSGLSGLTTAYSLAEKGFSVAIIEKNAELASEATGQSQLAQYAKLPTINNKEFRFTLNCLQFSQRYFTNLQTKYNEPFWHNTGLLQLAWNNKEDIKQNKLISGHDLPKDLIRKIDSQKASQLSGLDLSEGGLWFNNCGWLSPSIYSHFVSSHSNITTIKNTEVTKLVQSSDHSWRVHNQQRSFSAHSVVLATANATKAFDQASHLPIKPLRGQVTTINNPSLQESLSVVCGEGYLCPAIKHHHHIGATYDLTSSTAKYLESDNELNIKAIQRWLPGWLTMDGIAHTKEISGRAGLRCTTPDYMPVVGLAPKEAEFIERFPKLRNNANAHRDTQGSYYQNLYINVGHGSKGLISTPLCAEHISSLICKTPSPYDHEIITSLSPARFLIKDLIQRKR